MPPVFRIGYCTSGLQGQRLEDALRLISDLGYRGVFITLDVHHLDPFGADLAASVDRVRAILDERDLSVVVETGARYLLDPQRKHWPNLISREGAERREDLLRRALSLARDLGAPCISTWSGANHDHLPDAEAWDRLVAALDRALSHAQAVGVDIAFEPEPGMLVETVAEFHRLREALGRPERLRLSLDVGHLIATGEGEPADVIRSEKDLISCVAIEDMKRGIHEHLPFGDGDVDLKSVIDALGEIRFPGVVAVELGRHSHEGPYQARRSRDVLRTLGVPFANG